MPITPRFPLWLALAVLLPAPQRTAADDAGILPPPASTKPATVSAGAAQPTSTSPAPTSPTPTSRGPMLRLNKRSLGELSVEPKLTPEVNAGVISRAALKLELERGIGYFLRQVRAQPAFERGRFAGWRLLDLYRARTDVHVLVLQPGDTVVLVNGRAIERPEEFKSIWDGLAVANELVLDIKRSGRASKLRYTIAD